MTNEIPDLASNGKNLKWYQGLSRYQWWVLIIASMGWMFDTMDQQFFNLGRGPAMKQVLKVDPVEPGLKELGENSKSKYTAADLDELIGRTPLTPRLKDKLLTDNQGNPRESATRKDVAKVIGGEIMAPTFIEKGTSELPRKLAAVRLSRAYGSDYLADKKLNTESFDRTALEALGQSGTIDQQVVAEIIDKEQMDKQDSAGKTIPLNDLTLYVGKHVLAQKAGNNHFWSSKRGFEKNDLDEIVSWQMLSAADAETLLASAPDQQVDKDQVLLKIGEKLITDGQTFDQTTLHSLTILDAISKNAAEGLLKDRGGQPVTKDALTRYFGEQLAKTEADRAGDFATFVFVVGWACGGLFFGWVGDALGRAKTMALTILTYAIFTGLNGLAQDEWQFNILRLLTAFGVGGEFAAGAALVAESMPERSRPAALGTLQALSAIGNMMGAALAFFIMPTLGWRWLFAVGAVPGLVAVFVFLKLKEPEKWKEARRQWLEEKAAGITHKRSSYFGLLMDSRWRKRAIIGLLLGVVGVGGLWGVGFFTPELNRLIAKNYSEEMKERFVAVAFFLQQFGAFLGISAYTVVSLKMGRRPAFAFFFALAFIVVSYTFLYADTIVEAYVLAPLVGFVTLGPFGGYAIYFPELFPTRLRSTGVGFCYNVGRFLAALIPSFKSGLKGLLISGAFVIPFLPAVAGSAERAIRYGSFLMILIYLVGLFVLLFAPETKGQPLPEE